VGSAGVSCKDLGRKQAGLPRCPHETISFPFGFQTPETLEIRRAIGDGGGDLGCCRVSRIFFSGSVSFTTSLSLSLSLSLSHSLSLSRSLSLSLALSLSLSRSLLLWGNKHISKDEPSHWRTCFTFWKPDQPQAYCVSACVLYPPPPPSHTHTYAYIYIDTSF